jgi:hypothetical protein
MDRRPVIDKNGEVKSVFCNSSTKGLNDHLPRFSTLIRGSQDSLLSPFTNVY